MRNRGPITDCLIHRVTTYSGFQYACVRFSFPFLLPCLAYPVVSVDRWSTIDDLATSSLHSSRLSTFLMAVLSVNHVHSGMLSSHLFFCLPRLLPPWTVPCLMVLTSPDDLVMWPYHLSLRCLTVVRRSSWGPMACRVLFRTSSSQSFK